MAPSTDRTPPAGTLPPVVSNVRFANSLLGILIESLRIGPQSRRGMLSTIMEPLKIDPVPLGASQIPTHKPSRRCVASVLICPCASLSARHTTRARRDPRRAPRPRHAHRPLASPAGQNMRGRVRGGIFSSGRRRRCVVGGAFGTFRNYPKCPNQPKSGARSRAEVKYLPERARFPLFRTCLVAFVRVDGAERRPAGRREHFSYLGRS